MQIALYLTLVIALLILVLLIGRLFVVRKEPSAKREFGYLQWAIYLLNIVIFALSISLIIGIIYTLLSLFGRLDWITQFSTESGTGLSFSAELTTLGSFVEVINLLSALGILICMRSFMKNILAEEIFIFKNVRLARLSTIFLVLGSFIREGADTSAVVMQGEFHKNDVVQSYTYSFFSLNYLLVAVLVWTLSIVLEKAIAIADENEFTI